MFGNIRWKALALCFVFILSTLSFPVAGATVLAVGSAPDSGTGTLADPYIIDEPAELEWISENFTAVRAKYFRQTADIDMTGIAFDPIGNGSATAVGDPFNGTYDGQRFRISNLTINVNQFCAALFEYAADNCVIENVILENASITNNSTANYMMAAGIAANTGSAIIRNCSVSGTISAAGASFSSYAAGIVGQNYGDIFDCASTAAISNATANGNLGGIAAYVCYANAEVQRNYFAGSLSGAATTKGGIVGNNWQGTYANNVYLSTAATWAIGGDSSNAGAVAASDAQMKQRATFEGQGWDFSSLWKISEGSSYPKHITAPAKPTGVAAVESDGQLAITWNAAARASGYNLYVGTSAGVYDAPVAVSGTSKTLTGLANGTTLYITVKTLHNAEEGPAADEITATPHLSILDLAATAGSGKADFTFSAAVGANTVELMQSTGGEFTAVAGVSLTAASTSATVTGLVNATDYSFKLKMVYGSNTYYSNIVTVTVGDAVNTLSALTVSGTTLSPDFAPATLAYTASVASSVSSADVTATMLSSLSTMKISGAAQASGAAKTIALEYGSNAVSIAVTAENGSTRTYTLTITRALPAGMATQEASLGYDFYGGTVFYSGWYGGAQENAALKFDLSSYSGALTSATLYIYVSRADSIGANGAFNLFGSSEDGWDSSSGPASWDATPIQSDITGMPEGWYSIPVTNYVKNHFATVDKFLTFYFEGITAADDQDIAFYSPTNATNKPYLALMFQSNDAKLSQITVGGSPLAGFSPTTYSYSYIAPHDSDLSALVFASTVNDSASSQGSWSYNATEHKWTVTVTAEAGNTQTYTVNVSAAPSTDATLSAITVGGSPLAGFASGTLNYTIDVPHGTDPSAMVLASTVHDHMAAQGTWSYNAGTKKWSVTVTAEDGTTTKTYTVTINELPSTDATLSAITVGGSGLAGFVPSTLNYTYNVPHGTDPLALVLASTVHDHMATQTAWSYNAGTRKWSIIVTAEDGVTAKTYTVTVNELPSTDATLSAITVGGSGLAGFVPSTIDYTYNMPHGTDPSALVFASTVHDHMATQTAWSYNAGTKKWSVTVTAEDGTTTKTYAVTINELPSADATLSAITVGGSPLTGFASGTVNYTLDVPHGTDPSAMVLASTVHDHMATQGSWSYNAGTKKWSVTVTAEDGTTTKTYAVTINVLPDNNASLSAITVGGTPLAGFASGTLSYTLDVVHGTNIAALVFAGTLSDPNASMGSWSYNAAQKKWSVTVTAEDGTTTKTYTVTVNELPDNDASLSSITVGGSPLTGFASGTLNYTLDVPHGTNIAALVFAGTLSDPNASQGSWNYNAAQKKWSVTVTAEDGTTTKVYTVTVNELPSTDATLSSITVGGSALPGFASGTLTYTLDVPHGTDIAALVFASNASDHMASQSAWSYNAGTKKWSVTVTAEDGTTTKTYAVTVNELPSTDATLSSITVGGTALPGFASGTLDYSMDVTHGTDIAAMVFASTVHDHMATQTTWSYDSGTKKWSVTVTAENGTATKTYTVTVNELPSTDAALKSISVGGSALPDFDAATLAYTHEVARGTDFSALALTSEANDHMATQSAWAYNATTKTWSVTVTAEDGTTKLTYTVHITQPANNDATLSAIKVGGTDVTGFTPATRDYTVSVPYGTNPAALALSATATDPVATLGAWAYDSGTKKWSVTVTAEDGTTTLTYTITVTVLPSTDATLSVIRVNGTAIPGFAPGTLNYTVNVANGTNPASLTLTSQTANPTATQSAWAYSAAGQKWSVTVTAGDVVTKKTYTVTINVLPSANATLSAIWMDGEELAGFNPLVTSYTLTVPYGTDRSAINFTAETTDSDATMGDWAFDAETGKWSVKVTAENGTSTRTYGITVLLGPAPTATATLEPTASPTPVPTATQTAMATATASPTPTTAPTTAPTAEPTLAPVDAISVTISVTDGQSQLAGAMVTLEGIPHAADGSGLVRADLSPGTYSYTAEATGCITASGTITVSKDKTVFCIILAKQGMVVLHSGDESKPADPTDATKGGTVLIADPAALPKQSTVRLVVEEVKTVTKDAEAVKQAEGSDMEIVQLFDIYLLMDQQKIQPNAPVRVGVPVPESLKGRKLAIVRINDDGTVTRFETTESGGVLFFTVDHFSKYAIIAAEQPKAVLPLWLIIGMGVLLLLLAFLIVWLLVMKKKQK